MFGDYLKSRVKILILLLGVEVVFASVYFLFDLPVVTVVYPLILSSVLILTAGIIYFLLVLNKHKKLQKTVFFEPSGLLEKDYQEIIGKLKEEQEYSRQKTNSDYNNMV